jgi:hypothetical protein
MMRPRGAAAPGKQWSLHCERTGACSTALLLHAPTLGGRRLKQTMRAHKQGSGRPYLSATGCSWRSWDSCCCTPVIFCCREATAVGTCARSRSCTHHAGRGKEGGEGMPRGVRGGMGQQEQFACLHCQGTTSTQRPRASPHGCPVR